MVSAAGFTLRTALWGDHAFRAAKVYSSLDLDEIEDTSVYDYILDTTKSLPGNLRWQQVPPLAAISLPENPPIILTQNGVDGIEEPPYRLAFPREPHCLGDALHRHLAAGAGRDLDHLLLEEEQVKIQLFGDALGASCKVTVCKDIRYERWCKVTRNGSWKTVCAATGSDIQSLIKSSPEVKELVIDLLREIVETAVAVGIKIDQIDSLIEDLGGQTLQALPIAPSTLQDARKGTQTEVEVSYCAGTFGELQRRRGKDS